MKRFLLLFAVVFVFSTPSFAGLTATFGDQNASKVHRLEADSSGVVTFAADTGIKYPYTTGSTTTAFTAAQTGTTAVFTGAASGTSFTLPTAVVGMRYTVIGDVAKYFYIDAQSTDTIKLSGTSAGYRISNSGTAAIGDSITLFCAVANTWSIEAKSGTWAVGPGQ